MYRLNRSLARHNDAILGNDGSDNIIITGTVGFSENILNFIKMSYY